MKKLSKASNSTTAENQLADGALVNETQKGINNNTTTLASMFLQQNSTNTILIIVLAGIAAYLIYTHMKK